MLSSKEIPAYRRRIGLLMGGVITAVLGWKVINALRDDSGPSHGGIGIVFAVTIFVTIATFWVVILLPLYPANRQSRPDVPLLYRLTRMLKIKVQPSHFDVFMFNALMSGGCFAIWWGVLIGVICSHYGVVVPLPGPVALGLFLAFFLGLVSGYVGHGLNRNSDISNWGN